MSGVDQKADLDRQIARLVAYANEQGWAVTRAVSEIGSGLSDRPRLMRFGFEGGPEVLTSFCARLYGRRSARNRAKRALEAMGCG